MPTRGRATFVAASVAQFCAQTYPARELVIADDPEAQSFPHGCDVPNVRYLIAPPGLSLGAKRNWVNDRTCGLIVAHWDDDDYYAAHRLSEQYAFLLFSAADLVGYRDVEFWSDSGARWVYRGRPDYVIGSSMMYWRRAWERHLFPDIPVGSDSRWQRGMDRSRIATIPAALPIIARNHGGNLNKRDDEQLAKFPECWERTA
jgi:glycosyltransferase involved in cell wall biosynthesis